MVGTAAQILLDARWMAGLTQAEVAQRAGVSQQMVAQYERGKKEPSFTTLAALVAGCGVDLTTHLVPRPGLEDEPTRDLLTRTPADRLPDPFRKAMARVAEAADGLAFLVGGKTAARLHGAFVRLHELELWFPDDVDPPTVTSFLRRLDAADVGLLSGVSEPVAERILLAEGWSLAGPGVDLPVAYVAAFDCTVWWHPRDLGHLALQRALRLTANKRSDVTAEP